MNAAGIVCEYNPFHSGHKYHIDATRRLLGEDTGIVCVMSGSFVQRGDCAAFSKHARARAAISGGADLVLELPVPWVLSSAESFARGGMWILERLGIVTHLSFGSECGDIGTLKAAAEGSDSSEGNISELMASGISYAAARELALSEVDPALGAVLSSPNNILGVEYLKAIRRLGSKIEPITVPRHMAGHDGDIPVEGFASASYIRQNMDEIARFVPESCTDIYKSQLDCGRAPASLDNCERAILGRLRTMGEAEYDRIPFGGEGLSNRLMKAAAEANSLPELMELTKSKRYPMSRVRRMILSAWLGIGLDDGSGPPPYIRVLAANERGRDMLRDIKDRTYLPVITKPASAKNLEGRAGDIFRLEARATALWGLASPTVQSADIEWKTSPFIC